MAEVLFEITKDNLETGMRGYPVGYCTTSTVDPVKGLFYVGKPLSEMASWEPEQVIYLLYTGKEGNSLKLQPLKSSSRPRLRFLPNCWSRFAYYPARATR